MAWRRLSDYAHKGTSYLLPCRGPPLAQQLFDDETGFHHRMQVARVAIPRRAFAGPVAARAVFSQR